MNDTSTPTVARPARTVVGLGAINALLAVGCGAFAAHGLRDAISPRLLAVFQTGADYHLIHALGLILVGLALTQMPNSKAVRRSAWSMLAGIVLFSGSLYALALTGIGWLGAITPIGGSAFLLAWGLLAWGMWRD